MNRATFVLFLLAFSLQLATGSAQTTVFTYQGRVLDSGTNFNGTGQFQFALVTSTNANHTATATANISGGYVTGYTINNGGNGYVTAPTATIYGGGGANAAGTANISGGAVTSITVANPGNGRYTSAPTVTIAPPPADISYTTYWSNDGTSADGSEPSASVSVAVNNGLFTVVLGDTTQPDMMAINATLFNQPNLQLRIWFNDGANGFAALSPVQTLTPAPYAIYANTASNLINGLTIRQSANDSPNVIGGSSVNFVSSGVEGATIGGGGTMNYLGFAYSNSVTGNFGTVGGGLGNTASGYEATVGGGANNTASGYEPTVGGGDENTAGGNYATVGGGDNNTASGNYATVSGGYFNTADDSATVSGGYNNTASGYQATVGGGYGNTASGGNATVSGGYDNTAGGQYSFAAGQQAQALHQGAFVWADSQNATLSSTANDQFLIRAEGGVGIGTDAPAAALHVSSSGGVPSPQLRLDQTTAGGYARLRMVSGASWDVAVGGASVMNFYAAATPGGAGTNILTLHPSGNATLYGTLAQGSDRAHKENLKAIDPQQVLAKVAALPITEWNYITDTGAQHLGPMAQDFYAAFSLGADDKHITTIDEGGVALAAIQGLNQKLEQKQTEITELKQQNISLTQRLNELEATVKQLAPQK